MLISVPARHAHLEPVSGAFLGKGLGLGAAPTLESILTEAPYPYSGHMPSRAPPGLESETPTGLLQEAPGTQA